MKKFLLLTLVMLLPMIALPVRSQNIVGIWKCISSVDIVEGQTIYDYMKGQFLTVNADGTYISTSEYMGNGIYAIQGNQFAAQNSKGFSFTATYSVSGNKLTMEGGSSNDVYFSYIFERVEDINIVGTWKCISSVDVVEGKTINDYMKGQSLTVNADGTYTSTSEYMGNGTYSFQGNQFTAQSNLGAKFTAIVSVSGNQLTMQGTTSYSVEFYYIFEKSGGSSEEVRKFETGGITYIINDNGTTVSVTEGEAKYTGDISIPSSVSYNGKYYDVTAIAFQAFYCCEYLTSLTIPYGVTDIGNNVCSACWNLKSVSLPNSLKSIGSDAFSWCSSLRTVTIPNSVTSIGWTAFEGCIGLTSVISEIMDPFEIPDNVFENSSAETIATLTVPAGTKARYQAIKGWNIFKNIVEAGGGSSEEVRKFETGGITYNINDNGTSVSVIAGNTKYEGNVSIPSSVSYNGKSYDVTSIGSGAFSDCTRLTSISIPNSLMYIQYISFQNCSGLSTITLPKSIIFIGQSAFTGCSNLTKINSEIEKPFELEHNAFDNSTFKNAILTVPAGTKSLYQSTGGWNLFQNIIETGSDQSGDIDEEKEKNNGFSFIDGLVIIIEIPEFFEYEGVSYNVISIGDYATKNGKSNPEGSSVTIPKSIKTIGSYAFYDMFIFGVNIPKSVALIKSHAFCSFIDRLYIDSFSSWCNITFEDEISNPLWDANNLYINGELIHDIVIPEGVTSIPSYAFMGKAFDTISIPSSISSISKFAFGVCSNLTDLYCHSANVPTTDLESFDTDNIKNVVLHVPANSIDTYKNASPWNQFKKIVAIEGSGDNPSVIDSPIVGKWKFLWSTPYISFIMTQLEFKADGTFSYTSDNNPDYDEHGVFKIEGDLLYQKFSDEDDWELSRIKTVDSNYMKLIDLRDDGSEELGELYFLRDYIRGSNETLTGTWLGCSKHDSTNYYEEWVFNSDGTGTSKEWRDGSNRVSTETFTYTVSGSSIIIDWGDGSPETYDYSISGVTLTLTRYEKSWTYYKQGVDTSIRSIKIDKGEDEIYSLRGEKLKSPQKGINIIGGKKVLVK